MEGRFRIVPRRKEAVWPQNKQEGCQGEKREAVYPWGVSLSRPLKRFSLAEREKRFIFLLEKRSPFPYWAWFLIWEAPPLWSTNWPNCFKDNLCQHPFCMIGSTAQFCWESHPTWLVRRCIAFPHSLPLTLLLLRCEANSWLGN